MVVVDAVIYNKAVHIVNYLNWTVPKITKIVAEIPHTLLKMDEDLLVQEYYVSVPFHALSNVRITSINTSIYIGKVIRKAQGYFLKKNEFVSLNNSSLEHFLFAISMAMESFEKREKIRINDELKLIINEKIISFHAQKIGLCITYHSKSEFATDMKKIVDQLFLTLFLDQRTAQLITAIAKNISSLPKKRQIDIFEDWDLDTISEIMPVMTDASGADKLHWAQTVHGHKASIQIYQQQAELLLPYIKVIKIE